jgi:hypothetical protein
LVRIIKAFKITDINLAGAAFKKNPFLKEERDFYIEKKD